MLGELDELISAGIITKEKGKEIETYLRSKKSSGGNRLYTVFGILGALLIGTGLILIVAHNWDDLSRGLKAMISFVPLLIGQSACLFTLLRRNESAAWREGAASFTVLSIGLSISMISQIYNLPGSIQEFLLTWTLLSIPLVYFMKSSVSAILCLIGITSYGLYLNFGFLSSKETDLTHWIPFIALMPFYLRSIIHDGRTNSTAILSWFLALSFAILLSTHTGKAEDWMIIAYAALAGIYYLIGQLQIFSVHRAVKNPYLVLGALGVVCMSLPFTFADIFNEPFDSLWNDYGEDFPAFPTAIVLSFLLIALFVFHVRRHTFGSMGALAPVPVLLVIALLFITNGTIGAVLMNLALFIGGILMAEKGSRLDHLGILNFGLLILLALVLARFFDEGISFVIRGLMFLAVGIGFFIANMKLIKRRKQR